MKESVVVNGVEIDHGTIEWFAAQVANYSDIQADSQEELDQRYQDRISEEIQWYKENPLELLQEVIEYARNALDYDLSSFRERLKFDRESPCQSLRRFYRRWWSGSFPASVYNRDIVEYPENNLWIRVTPLYGKYSGRYMIQGFYKNYEIFNHLE